MTETLSRKALNRATLARQLLLERSTMGPLEAVERLVGLQAQEAKPPFIGLWTRLIEFEHGDLTGLLQSRQLVRATALRGTLHLMSANDFATFRATLQPMLSAAMRSILKARADEIDLDGLIERATAYLDRSPATFQEVRQYISDAYPGGDVRALGYAIRTHIPLVQVPAKTLWGYPAAASFALAESWLGEPMSTELRTEELVLRYLAAFGPATVADAEAWSYLRGLRPIFEALRPKLVVFRDERKRELFDLPDAPRPHEDAPAPIRFLPDFDNLVLSHVDRTRVISEAHRKRIDTPNLRIPGLFLVDGFVAGRWKLEQKKREALLVIEPFEEITDSNRQELVREGMRLAEFAAPDAGNWGVTFSAE